MCDSHDFGLAFFFIMCFCSFENVKKCVLGGYTITSKAKINVHSAGPFGAIWFFFSNLKKR